jgi:molybdopterin synthase catalytic subunit/molybdopterin converting factor small subunit
VIQVQVLPFGVLKDWLGAQAATVEVREGATVAELLAQLSAEHGGMQLRGIAVSVNAEYAQVGQVLRAGDEVGLLPPVSGGSGEMGAGAKDANPGGSVRLTRESIDGARWAAEAKRGEDGAVVVFDGIVRNNTRGRKTLHLDYEAYEEMALKQMEALAVEARAKFGVREVKIVHRLGRLQVGETSVLIVVASAHRGQAFDACRWVIDTLKKTVPIWKKETFEDGVVWADGEPFPDGMAVAPEGSNGG